MAESTGPQIKDWSCDLKPPNLTGMVVALFWLPAALLELRYEQPVMTIASPIRAALERYEAAQKCCHSILSRQ